MSFTQAIRNVTSLAPELSPQPTHSDLGSSPVDPSKRTIIFGVSTSIIGFTTVMLTAMILRLTYLSHKKNVAQREAADAVVLSENRPESV